MSYQVDHVEWELCELPLDTLEYMYVDRSHVVCDDVRYSDMLLREQHMTHGERATLEEKRDSMMRIWRNIDARHHFIAQLQDHAAL